MKTKFKKVKRGNLFLIREFIPRILGRSKGSWVDVDSSYDEENINASLQARTTDSKPATSL